MARGTAVLIPQLLDMLSFVVNCLKTNILNCLHLTLLLRHWSNFPFAQACYFYFFCRSVTSVAFYSILGFGVLLHGNAFRNYCIAYWTIERDIQGRVAFTQIAIKEAEASIWTTQRPSFQVSPLALLFYDNSSPYLTGYFFRTTTEHCFHCLLLWDHSEWYRLYFGFV